MDWRPKFKTQSLKLLEENTGTAIFGIKAKINKRDLIPFKRFCTAKETLAKKMKRQPPEWRKRFVNDTTNKRLISKMLKQLL